MSKQKLFFFFFSFFILFHQKSYAQKEEYFAPTINDSLFFNKEFKEIEERFKANSDAISGDLKKEFKEIYKERFENIKQNFISKKLFTNIQAQAYLLKILEEITKNNKELEQIKLNIFFCKTEIPNATFVGENTILFNTGLFNKLQNESQVAFVLCHELAHLYLNHSDKFIEKYVTTVNSKEFQKELKSIKNSEYKKRAQLEKLALNLQFDNKKHSRFKESEADSMAIVFLTNTKFDNRESINLLGILDTLDKDNFDAENCLKNNFNCKDYPFKNSWLEKEDGLLGGHVKLKADTLLLDSLKTHPDCKVRIKGVKKMLEKFTQINASKTFINPELFNSLHQKMVLENIAYYVEKNNYSSAFYYCLKQFEKTPNNPYLNITIGKIFNQFYEAQKKHQLNRITTMPFPNNDPSFNLVLQFIQNLYVDDYKNIANNFLKKRENLFSNYSEYIQVLNETKPF